jgi:heme exporter protein C
MIVLSPPSPRDGDVKSSGRIETITDGNLRDRLRCDAILIGLQTPRWHSASSRTAVGSERISGLRVDFEEIRKLKLSFTVYSNPGNFLRIAAKLLPWLWGSTVFAFALGLFGTFDAPPDYQQGETARIMYIHVPAAWTAMLAYTLMAMSALGSLVWRHPLADATQKAAAPLGAAFTFICLVTGALWGKPMWGTYWVWDARLTSVLVLFLIYLGLIALWQTIEEPSRAARAVSIMTLVGFINIPIVKFSVDWWNTLHQPASVFRMEGSAIAGSMLWPLIVMALAYTLLFATLHVMAVRNEIMRRRARRLAITLAAVGEPATARMPPAEAAS